MTRKDYILIANVLKCARIDQHATRVHNADRSDCTDTAFDRAANYMAAMLAEDNAIFNRFKFLAACGMVQS